MKRSLILSLVLMLVGSVLFTASATADSFFEVTVTNVTKGQSFTPIMVASTRKGDQIFRLGDMASAGLEKMAETGDLTDLIASLDAFDVSDSSFLPFLDPGESVTQVVATRGRYTNVTVAAMLVPTNDTFFAVNGRPGPRGNKTITRISVAYDAGTETNDELCISLPGPGCGPDPGGPSVGEGYVYISNGIHGVGDLPEDLRDFNNPVAVITITRMSGDDDDDD